MDKSLFLFLSKCYVVRILNAVYTLKRLLVLLKIPPLFFEPILPWTAAGAYMAGTLGVANLSYLPWAVLCWSGIFFCHVMGVSPVLALLNYTRRAKEEMTAELGSHSELQLDTK